jgi:hypothetical protein
MKLEKWDFKIIRMIGKIRWTSEIFESLNLRIFENKNKYYSLNHSKMIKNLDFEIVERMIILIINFVLASGVIISNAIIQKRTQNWIQNFQVFIVTDFMILQDDSMSVLMMITYDSNDTSLCDESPGPDSRFWCLFLWFHELFSKNSISFISCLRWCFEVDESDE